MYTFAADPAVLIYNKRLIPEAAAPRSVHDIAALVAAKPELKNRISTYSVSGQFGRAANWAWIQKNPDAWDVLAKLGPITRPERTVGPMIEKVTTGEYALAWLVSGAALFEKLKSPAYASILGWSYIADGTPVIPRRMGIVTTARSPNASKLLVDYLLSRDGQTAIAKDGGTPYRDDLDPGSVTGLTYGALVKAVGSDGLVREELSAEYVAARQAFLDRWKSTFVQAK
ncbi:MAG: ABC transporter substrate-binding protein [Microvirga sp.]